MFEGGGKLGPNSIKAGVYKFVLRAFQRKPRASAFSLGSLAPGNILDVLENWPELAENDRPRSLNASLVMESVSDMSRIGQRKQLRNYLVYKHVRTITEYHLTSPARSYFKRLIILHFVPNQFNISLSLCLKASSTGMKLCTPVPRR